MCYNCVLNYGLGVVGLEMAMDFSSTKWNRCYVRGLSTDNPLLSLGLLKIVPICMIGPQMSMCYLHEIG